MLHSYTGDPDLRYGSTTTAAFEAHASAAAGRDLTAWFDPWLRTAEVPVLAWSWSTVPVSGRAGDVRIDVAQQQATLFELDLPVFVVSGGDTTSHTVVCRGPITRVVLPASGKVTDVLLDPEGTLLLTTSPLPEPPIAITAIGPNPTGPQGADVTFSLLHPGPVTMALYDARGRETGRWELGEHEAGTEHRWSWPGAGDRASASGVFWLEATGGGGRSVRKVTVIR